MAWQGQKDIQTSKYPHMALNVDVWNIVHSGNTLTFSATVRAIVTSGNLYYNGVSVSLTGGGSITKNMNPVSTGGYVDFGTFNCSASVPASTTSYTITASLSAGTVASGSASWVLNFGQGGSLPSGVTPVFNSSTWNSVNSTTRISSWGGATPTRLEGIIVTGSSNADFGTITSSNWTTKGRRTYWKNTSATAETFNMTDNNVTQDFDNPIGLKGMREYYLACWAVNSVGGTGNIDMTVRYLPPAPAQFTYTDPGGQGAKTYPVEFTGVAANNTAFYDTSELKRTVRYKIDNGAWTVVDNDTVALIDFVTAFNVVVPAGSTATIEGWMTYRGQQSEVSTITLSNTNSAVALYGSVNGQTKLLGPVYASVNGRAKKLVKIYASVGGVTKKVYEDV